MVRRWLLTAKSLDLAWHVVSPVFDTQNLAGVGRFVYT